MIVSTLPCLPLKGLVPRRLNQQFQDQLPGWNKSEIPFSAMCLSETGINNVGITVHLGPQAWGGQVSWAGVARAAGQ